MDRKRNYQYPTLPTNTRRQFLIGTLGIAWTANSTRLATAGSDRTKKVTVGAHPWVYAATQPQYDITPILDTIFADMQYADMDGIELMHTALRPDDAVSRIRTLSDRHNLPIIGTSFGGEMWNRAKHQEVLDDAKLVVSRLSKLGGRTLGTSVGSAGHVKIEEELDAQAELLKAIMKICNDHGVALNLHNHTYEIENDLHDLKGTLKRIPEAKLGPDLDWLVQGGVDPVQFIRTYRDRIVFLHLRDQKKDKTWVESLGEGDMDYQAVGKALQEINFQGDAVIELAHPKDFKPIRPLRESLKMSRDYVRTVLHY